MKCGKLGDFAVFRVKIVEGVREIFQSWVGPIL